MGYLHCDALGTSVDAVRKRIKRGTLDHEKGEDGRLYVFLDDSLEHESNALISELRERIAFLERELEARTEEIHRRDAILMNMTQIVKPAIEPPPRWWQFWR
jgi:hypothetical protein